MRPNRNLKLSFALRPCRIFGLAAAAFLASCTGGQSKDRTQPPPASVGYIVVSPTTVPLAVSLSGRTVAFETSEVRPQVSGVIRKRYFTEGSYVRTGQRNRRQIRSATAKRGRFSFRGLALKACNNNDVIICEQFVDLLWTDVRDAGACVVAIG